MKYPKIYLTLDNCFAIKRWVEPKTWMPLARELGFSYVEASFDNEIDFLYSPKWYVDEWFQEVEQLEKETGVQVANFFTGYQTYRTSGLGHPNKRMAEHLLENWMKPAIENLGRHKAGIGFAFHSIIDEALQDPEKYRKVTDEVTDYMARIAKYAADNGDIPVCVEQMYAPHQPPWTIKGTQTFLRDCYAAGGNPIYTTIDLGHMVGQCRFRHPSLEQILKSLEEADGNTKHPDFWLGAESTYDLWNKAVKAGDRTKETAKRIFEDTLRFPYMFSYDNEDSDPYAWVESLACYSPIMHMQQTNGITSSHAAFTEKNNSNGIIKGEKLLRAIAKSYESGLLEGMPPRVDKIYLSFEIFASNTEYRYDILEKLKQTSDYWHQYVPQDGLPLDELIARISK